MKISLVQFGSSKIDFWIEEIKMLVKVLQQVKNQKLKYVKLYGKVQISQISLF
jgi:hypothetical protein